MFLMFNLSAMIVHRNTTLTSAIFITFSGNCKRALTFYQTCFGGVLQFETFEKKLEGYTDMLVVCGSLMADSIIIHGSDLVHDEGRKPGNHISIFLQCKNSDDRKALIEKLQSGKKHLRVKDDEEQKLIELTDAFDVRWMMGV